MFSFHISIVAIQIPTVSFSESDQNISALQEFDLLLRRGEELMMPKAWEAQISECSHEVLLKF